MNCLIKYQDIKKNRKIQNVEGIMTWHHSHLPRCLGFQTKCWQLNMRVVLAGGLNPIPYGTSWRQPCTTYHLSPYSRRHPPLSRGFVTCEVLTIPHYLVHSQQNLFFFAMVKKTCFFEIIVLNIERDRVAILSHLLTSW